MPPISEVQETERNPVFGYVLLSGTSGVTAGMLKVIAALFAIRLGANTVQIGIISGMESLFMALVTIPAGILVGHFGARNVYVAGSMLITMVYILSPGVQTWSLLALAAGLGGACMPLRMVALNGSFMERLRQFGEEKAGWYRAAGIAGNLIAGPSLATSLFVAFGVHSAYWGAAALFAMMGVIGFFQLPNRPPPGTRGMTVSQRLVDIVRLTRHPVVARICVIELSSGVVFAFFTAFIVIFGIQSIGLSEPAAVSVRFAEAVVSVATMIFAGAFLARRRPIALYRASVLINVAGFVLLALSDSYPMLVLSAAMLGIGFGATQVVNVQQLSRLEIEKGKVVSLQLLCTMGGTFLGAALGGVIAKDAGFEGMFFSAAALYALLSIRWCFERRRTVEPVVPAPHGEVGL